MRKIISFLFFIAFSFICNSQVEINVTDNKSIIMYQSQYVGFVSRFKYDDISYSYTTKFNSVQTLYTDLHITNIPEFTDTLRIYNFLTHEEADTITIDCKEKIIQEKNLSFKILCGEYGGKYNEKNVMQYFDWIKVIDLSTSRFEKIVNTKFYSDNENYSLEKVYFPKTLRSIEGEFCRFHIDSIFCYDLTYPIRITENTFVYDKTTIVVVNKQNIYEQMLEDENWSKFTIVLEDNKIEEKTSIDDIKFYDKINGLYYQNNKIMYKGKELKF